MHGTTIILVCCAGGDDESPWSLQPKADERLWGVRAGRGEVGKMGGRKGEKGKRGMRKGRKPGKTETEQGSEDSGHSSLGVVPSDVFY